MTEDRLYERKVQLTGGTTYTVSLPKSWARTHGLAVGDHVHLHPRGDRLLVTKAAAREGDRTVAVPAGRYDPPRLARIVTAAYVAGVTAIRITERPDSSDRAAVRDAVAGLVGVEIAEETDTAVVVRTMLDVEDLSPIQTLAQLESVTLAAHGAAVKAVLTADGEAGRRVAADDDAIDRLFGLVAREFHRSLVDVTGDAVGDGLTTFDAYTVARQLERVGDHAAKIGRVADRIDTAPPAAVGDDLDAIAADARGVVRDALSATLNDRDPDRLCSILADGEAVVEAAKELDRELYARDLADGYALATVLDSLIRTAEYGRNIAEAGLRASLRTSIPDPLVESDH
ncbi:MAG: PhoU domain-containing protein [Halorubrum sp.]